jgi:RHS repeat-associated protein
VKKRTCEVAFFLGRTLCPRTHENGAAIASYDHQDRLLSWRGRTYTYNAAGDLQSRSSPAGTTDYSYDALGALRQVKTANGKTITYDIDPSGRRTGKSVDGQKQWHLVWQSKLKPLAQLKPDGSIDAVFYYAEHLNVPSAMRKGGKDYQIVTDHLGSVRLVIDVNTAQVVQRMNYDAWGSVTEDTNPGFQPFGFAGGLYDPDTQLTRFGARDYDGETGRWTAKDPILFDGGDSNLYGYVLQNPIDYFDPEGMQSVSADSENATLQSAIARGDVKQLENLMEALGPQNQIIARQAIEKFSSKAVDWISRRCKGSINREFPG